MRRSTRSSSAASNSQSSQEDSVSQEEDSMLQKKKKKTKKPPLCKPSQWVTVLPERAVTSKNLFIALEDPKTGTERQYLIIQDSQLLCEVHRCSDEPRSWLVGESVQTDGSLLVCTPVDPLFLALPYLTRTAKAGKFTTLEAILDDPTHTNSLQLQHYVRSEQWKHVCDSKVLPDDMIVYRYNPTKTLQWLKKKVDVLSAQLKAQQINVGSGSQSSSLIRSKKHNSANEEDYLHYACGMVCEYLNEELAATLSQCYNLTDPKRKLEEDSKDQPSAKKQRTDSVDSGVYSQQSSLEDSQMNSEQGGRPLTCTPAMLSGDGPLEDYTKYNTPLPSVPTTKTQKQTVSQKALSKVNKKGMKSLSALWGTKT